MTRDEDGDKGPASLDLGPVGWVLFLCLASALLGAALWAHWGH